MFLQAVGAQAGSRILCFWGEKYIFKGARFCLNFSGRDKIWGHCPECPPWLRVSGGLAINFLIGPAIPSSSSGPGTFAALKMHVKQVRIFTTPFVLSPFV